MQGVIGAATSWKGKSGHNVLFVMPYYAAFIAVLMDVARNTHNQNKVLATKAR